MDKFAKRIRKNLGNVDNALVLGQAFGHLENFLSIFNTIFLIDENPPQLKAKNLVYRENFQDFGAVCNITTVIVDLNMLKNLDKSISVMSRYKPVYIIEGSEVVEQGLARSLLSNGYVPVERHESYHIWKIKT